MLLYANEGVVVVSLSRVRTQLKELRVLQDITGWTQSTFPEP